MSVNNTKSKFDQMRTHLSGFAWKIVYDWSFSLSALIAYNLLTSLLPLMLCLFAVASFLFADNPDVLTNIRGRLVKTFPDQGLSNAADTLLKSLSKKAGIIFLITFIVSVFTASRLLIVADDVLTIIYRMRERPVLAQNIHAIKMLLAFIILMPAILLCSFAPAILTGSEQYYQVGTTLSGGLFGFILFELIYYYVPKRQMYWRDTYVESFSYINKLNFLYF
jgi:uncharacterized BrkB/YihY/UPF0761 family membrane protein